MRRVLQDYIVSIIMMNIKRVVHFADLFEFVTLLLVDGDTAFLFLGSVICSANGGIGTPAKLEIGLVISCPIL